MDTIVKQNKIKLIRWLRGDTFIIQHVHSSELITEDEYSKLKSTQDSTARVTEMLDMIIHKGPTVCKDFLDLLKKDDVNESSPELRTWINALPTSETQVKQEVPTQNSANTNTSLAGIHHIKDYKEFLRKKRSALIDKVKNVVRIADDLNLSNEMLAIVQAKETDQDKMRKVLEFTNSKTAEELLIKALFTHAGDVMQDLIEGWI